jgi:hypothetical protein
MLECSSDIILFVLLTVVDTELAPNPPFCQYSYEPVRSWLVGDHRIYRC